MKKIDLGQLITVVANIGILVGLAFLGYELRQNNELMAAEARFNRVSMATQLWGVWAENGELAELRVRATTDEQLSDAEHWRILGAVMREFVQMEWNFRELPENSPERIQMRATARLSFAVDPNYRRVWEQRKNGFAPDFVQWLEGVVEE